MNTLKYITLLLGFSFTLAACDLETSPTTSIDTDKVYRSVSDAENVLNGAWKNLFETFYTYRNPGFGATLRTDDAMGSDVVLNTKYGYRNHYALTAIYNKTDYTGNLSWELGYETIFNANSVIHRIDALGGSDTERNRLKGQAYALRGYMYLHFASHYAFAVDKDPNAVCVPIYTEEVDVQQAEEGKPAASVSEVYAQAISDLEEALRLIPANYVRNAKYKIDRQVVLGLLSRASLYARQWDKAKQYSDELLQLNDYLMTKEEWRSGFNDISNREWIWGHPQTADQRNASYMFHFLDTTTDGSYYYSFNVDPYFAALYDQDDYRNDFVWDVEPGADKSKLADGSEVWLRSKKFRFRDMQMEIGDIVLMRVGEIFLINAEAKAELGDATAVEVLNRLQKARGTKLTPAGLSKTELLQAIWLERRKELWGEGFSLVDIIRNRQSIDRKEYTNTDMSYEFTTADGTAHTVKVNPKGHYVTKFPDKSNFASDSKYYLYRIPDKEETTNKHLYELHPKLDIYR